MLILWTDLVDIKLGILAGCLIWWTIEQEGDVYNHQYPVGRSFWNIGKGVTRGSRSTIWLGSCLPHNFDSVFIP